MQELDKNILEKFREETENERPLICRNLRKKNPNWQNTWIFSIGSNKMSQSLIKLGCTPRKSMTLKFPNEEQVPKHLHRHFIRGYFDGDGCIVCGKGGLNLGIVSTEDFCVGIKKSISVLNVGGSIVGKKFISENKPTRILTYTGSVQAKIVMDWLYKDATVFLIRKRKKYESYLKLIEERRKIKHIEAFGEKKPIGTWARDIRASVGRKTIAKRIKNGWSNEDAITIKAF